MEIYGLEKNCICMSGKKYKNCCYKDRTLYEISNEQWYKVDNNYYLEKLLNNKKFNAYYFDIYNKLDKQIYFAITLNPGSNKSARYFEHNNKNYYVILVNDKKAKKEEMFEVAHEMQHFICGKEGFPILAYDPELGTYPNTLMNIIADPIVNKRLVEKKFDFKNYFSFAANSHYNIINEYPMELDRETELWILFVTVEKILDGELIRINKDDNIIYNLVKNKYPNLINDIDKIYKYIKDKDYNNKEIAYEIYNELINYYKLQNKIQIIY